MQRKARTVGHSWVDAPDHPESFILLISDRLRRQVVPFTTLELTLWLRREWEASHEQAMQQIDRAVQGLMRENWLAAPGKRIYVDVACIQRRTGYRRQTVEEYFANHKRRITKHNRANGMNPYATKYWRSAA